MKINTIRYRVHLSVEFTQRDVKSLLMCSRNHYDFECRKLSQPGGLLFGLNNKFEHTEHDGTAEWTIDWTTADILLKTAEYAEHFDKEDCDPQIWIRMQAVFNRLRELEMKANHES